MVSTNRTTYAEMGKQIMDVIKLVAQIVFAVVGFGIAVLFITLWVGAFISLL